MANRNFANSRIYTGHVMPVLIDCNFVVDSTSATGITSLKGPYVQNVFMHTSGAAGAGNSNPATPNIVVTNPNPASGTIVVQLQNNFNRYISGFNSKVSPLGTPVKIDNSAMTTGVAYVITTLGDATAAKWRAIGVPAGVTPAVGTPFIAASNGGAGNVLTSRVAPTAAAGSGIASIELVGNSNLVIAPSITAQGFGAQIILQCRNVASTSSTPTLTMNSYTPAGTNDGSTPPLFTGTPATLTGTVSAPTITSAAAIAAPADGTLISLSFMLSNSSVLIQGE